MDTTSNLNFKKSNNAFLQHEKKLSNQHGDLDLEHTYIKLQLQYYQTTVLTVFQLK
jgi:hypothetical protein